MDTRQSRHFARLHHLRESFAAANERLVAYLRGADDEAAVRTPADGSWSAAQTAWHVAKVTTRFAGILSGDTPGAQALPPDFREREWSAIEHAIPGKLKTSDVLQPPAYVTRTEAIAALEASAVRMARALDRVTEERGERHGISSPIVGGAINLYQVGEWATNHVVRHTEQARRALGGE